MAQKTYYVRTFDGIDAMFLIHRIGGSAFFIFGALLMLRALQSIQSFDVTDNRAAVFGILMCAGGAIMWNWSYDHINLPRVTPHVVTVPDPIIVTRQMKQAHQPEPAPVDAEQLTELLIQDQKVNSGEWVA